MIIILVIILLKMGLILWYKDREIVKKSKILTLVMTVFFWGLVLTFIVTFINYFYQ